MPDQWADARLGKDDKRRYVSKAFKDGLAILKARLGPGGDNSGGIYFVTGARGAGKSTFLHWTLDVLRDEQVLAFEVPVDAAPMIAEPSRAVGLLQDMITQTIIQNLPGSANSPSLTLTATLEQRLPVHVGEGRTARAPVVIVVDDLDKMNQPQMIEALSTFFSAGQGFLQHLTQPMPVHLVFAALPGWLEALDQPENSYLQLAPRIRIQESTKSDVTEILRKRFEYGGRSFDEAADVNDVLPLIMALNGGIPRQAMATCAELDRAARRENKKISLEFAYEHLGPKLQEAYAGFVRGKQRRNDLAGGYGTIFHTVNHLQSTRRNVREILSILRECDTPKALTPEAENLVNLLPRAAIQKQEHNGSWTTNGDVMQFLREWHAKFPSARSLADYFRFLQPEPPVGFFCPIHGLTDEARFSAIIEDGEGAPERLSCWRRLPGARCLEKLELATNALVFDTNAYPDCVPVRMLDSELLAGKTIIIGEAVYSELEGWKKKSNDVRISKDERKHALENLRQSVVQLNALDGAHRAGHLTRVRMGERRKVSEYKENSSLADDDLIELSRNNSAIFVSMDGLAGHKAISGAQPIPVLTCSPPEGRGRPGSARTDPKTSTGASSSSKGSDGTRGARPAAAAGKMHPAVCSACERDTEVPFRPWEGRQVYCPPCFKKTRRRS